MALKTTVPKMKTKGMGLDNNGNLGLNLWDETSTSGFGDTFACYAARETALKNFVRWSE